MQHRCLALCHSFMGVCFPLSSSFIFYFLFSFFYIPPHHRPLTDDGCVFKEPPVRLQYLSSDFFSSPVLAISGQFSGMCENDEMTTLVFWDLEGNLAPVCGNVSDEQGVIFFLFLFAFLFVFNLLLREIKMYPILRENT